MEDEGELPVPVPVEKPDALDAAELLPQGISTDTVTVDWAQVCDGTTVLVTVFVTVGKTYPPPARPSSSMSPRAPTALERKLVVSHVLLFVNGSKIRMHRRRVCMYTCVEIRPTLR